MFRLEQYARAFKLLVYDYERNGVSSRFCVSSFFGIVMRERRADCSGGGGGSNIDVAIGLKKNTLRVFGLTFPRPSLPVRRQTKASEIRFSTGRMRAFWRWKYFFGSLFFFRFLFFPIFRGGENRIFLLPSASTPSPTGMGRR